MRGATAYQSSAQGCGLHRHEADPSATPTHHPDGALSGPKGTVPALPHASADRPNTESLNRPSRWGALPRVSPVPRWRIAPGGWSDQYCWLKRPAAATPASAWSGFPIRPNRCPRLPRPCAA